MRQAGETVDRSRREARRKRLALRPETFDTVAEALQAEKLNKNKKKTR